MSELSADNYCRNIIENRYGFEEGEAANDASYLLAGSLIFYPIVSTFDLQAAYPLMVFICSAASSLTDSSTNRSSLPS